MTFPDDGLQHTYSTCPRCHNIVSDENMVSVDGQRMCRQCLKELTEKARQGKWGGLPAPLPHLDP